MAQRFSIHISSKGGADFGVQYISENKFKIKYNNPIYVDPADDSRWYIAAAFVQYSNSRINISSAYNNNKFYYNNGVDDVIIDIPDGNWSLSNLNKHVIAAVKANGDNLPGDLSPITFGFHEPTMKANFSVAAGYSVTFPVGQSLNLNLGINEGTVITNDYLGDSIVDMNRGVDMMHIMCDLVDAGDSVRLNSYSDDLLISLGTTGAPGATIKYEPNTLRWQPMLRTNNDSIDSITVNIKDGLLREFNTRTNIEITLMFERRDRKSVV